MRLEHQPGWRTQFAKLVLKSESYLHPRLFRILLGATWPLFRNSNGFAIAQYDQLPMWFNLLDPAERQGWQGIYDPPLINVIQTFCKPGMTFIDIGANVGIVSSSVAGQIGAEGYILQVEPNPSLAKRLRMTAERNPYRNLFIEELAAGTESGSLPFYVSRFHTYSTLIKEQLPNYPVDSIVQVKVMRLNDILALVPENRHIHLLKLDAEGVDLNVILDAKLEIGKREIDMIVVEANDKKVDEVINQFQSLGYQAWAVDGRECKLQPWGTITTANNNLFLTLPSVNIQ